MPKGGVCPVCELSDDVERALPGGVEPPAPTTMGRFWQSGRAGLLLAAMLFAAASVVPLWSVQARPPALARVGVTAWEMIVGEGPLGTEMKSVVMVVVPAAALALFQLLLVRRTRSSMVASRPLMLVLALLPLVAGLVPALRLGRLQRRQYGAHAGMVLLGLGAALGALGASRFGAGVAPEPDRKRRREEPEA